MTRRPRSSRRLVRPVRRGFSLIELLIAIAILLAIGAIVAINLRPSQEKAKVDLTTAQITEFGRALELFRTNLDRFPSEEEGISVLWSKANLENEDDEAKWNAPYLKQPRPNDEWGNEWVYVFPSEEVPGMYEIRSSGPDGEPDTEDDISSLDTMRGADGELDEAFEDFSVDGDADGGGSGG